MADVIDARVYGMMQTGKPFATYRKTILGKVAVKVFSPLTQTQEDVILYGDPKKDEAAFIDVWSEKEDVYLKRMNKSHFNKGLIIKVQREEKKEEVKTIEQYSDAELTEVLGMRFLPFNKLLTEIENSAVLYRLMELAKELEKSDKVVSAIEARLATVQAEVKPVAE